MVFKGWPSDCWLNLSRIMVGDIDLIVTSGGRSEEEEDGCLLYREAKTTL